MSNQMNNGTTIRDLEKTTDGVFNVEEFRKSLLAERAAKILQFPSPKKDAVTDAFDSMFAAMPSFLQDSE